MKAFTSALAIAAAIAFSGSVSAAELKPKTTKSNGSPVGQASSSFTGNGAEIGGGTKGDGQTTEPGSRAEEVHEVQASGDHPGKGKDKN